MIGCELSFHEQSLVLENPIREKSVVLLDYHLLLGLTIG